MIEKYIWQCTGCHICCLATCSVYQHAVLISVGYFRGILTWTSFPPQLNSVFFLTALKIFQYISTQVPYCYCQMVWTSCPFLTFWSLRSFIHYFAEYIVYHFLIREFSFSFYWWTRHFCWSVSFNTGDLTQQVRDPAWHNVLVTVIGFSCSF